MFDPGLLYRVRSGLPQRLDGNHGFAYGRRYRKRTRTQRHAIHMHGAGAASRDAAPQLGAGEGEVVAQVPEQGHGGIADERAGRAIHRESHGGTPEAGVGAGRANYISPNVGFGIGL